MKKWYLPFIIMLLSVSTFAQLSGTKTIGAAGDYPTIAAAITALNTNGVNGPVVFTLIDTAYNETGASLYIKDTVNAPTAANTVTFKPGIGVSPKVYITGCTATAGATQYAGFTITATSYITIDGSNTVGGTTKDLSFVMKDGTNGRLVFNLYANADYITIKNCNIGFVAPMSSSSNSSGIYANGQAAGVADNILIQNNTIGDTVNIPYYAIRMTGNSGGSVNCSNILIKDNILTAAMRVVYYYYVGSNGTTSEIVGNIISAPSTFMSGYVVYGILMNTYGGTVNISKNKISTLKTNNGVGQGLFGLSTLSGQAGNVVNINNNFISDLQCLKVTGDTTPVAGLYFQDAINANVYFNTIDINTLNNTKSIVAGIRCGGAANVNLKNNIISNKYNTNLTYGIYRFSGTFVSDYNDIYVPDTAAFVGYYSGNQKTLANWQTASSLDSNSKTVNVNFASIKDLHLVGTSIGDQNLAGTPIASVLFDIDGQMRDLGKPYIGADEDTAHALPVELSSLTANVSGKTVILNWSTATELNNRGFEVEKNVNGTWSSIGFVKGAGSSTEMHRYSFVDNNVSGKIEYRLKQVDMNGAFSYSKVIAVNATAPVNFELSQNYPNPFNPTTTIRFSVPQKSNVKLEVYSITGQLVAVLFNGEKNTGRYEISFDASKLASGTYIYKLTNGSSVLAKKMMLIK